MDEEKGSGKNKKVFAVLIVILLLIVIAVLGIVVYRLLNQKEKVERQPSEGVIVDPENEPKENPRFTTDMNVVWTFPSGERTSNDAIIGNSAANEYDTYFEVYLEDEDQTLLYSSPVLPIGKRLDKLKIDKVLKDGQYAALCTFHLVDPEDHDREVSNVTFNVTLIVGDIMAE